MLRTVGCYSDSCTIQPLTEAEAQEYIKLNVHKLNVQQVAEKAVRQPLEVAEAVATGITPRVAATIGTNAEALRHLVLSIAYDMPRHLGQEAPRSSPQGTAEAEWRASRETATLSAALVDSAIDRVTYDFDTMRICRSAVVGICVSQFFQQLVQHNGPLPYSQKIEIVADALREWLPARSAGCPGR